MEEDKEQEVCTTGGVSRKRKRLVKAREKEERKEKKQRHETQKPCQAPGQPVVKKKRNKNTKGYAKSPRKRTSDVWADFTELGSINKCKICGRVFRGTTSTTNLKSHLLKEHASEATALVNSNFDPSHADELLAGMIAHNYLPFRLVDDEDFRAVFTYINPTYTPPSRKKLVDTLLPNARDALEAHISAKLKTIGSVALSFDSWTSTANRSYVGITAHGITKTWALESFLLSAVTDDETGAFLAQVVEDVLGEWGIQKGCVISATSDGAANAKNAVTKQLELPWVCCFAHVINRSVRKALEHDCVRDLLQSAKAICKFFKSSPKAARALKQKQSVLDVPAKTLKIDNKTRWGSAFKMMKRMCASRPAISACLASMVGTRRSVPDDLTTQQWAILAKLVEVLRHLNEASEFIAQQKHPTIGVVMPIMNQLLNSHLLEQVEEDSDEKEKEDDESCIKKFKAVLRADLGKRWSCISLDSSEVLLLAVYLDPRVKDFGFIEDEEYRNGLLKKARRIAEDHLRNPSVPFFDSPHAIDSPSPSPTAKSPQLTKLTRLFGDKTVGACINRIENAIEIETREYQAESPCPMFDTPKSADENAALSDPLDWWKTHAHKFPRLAKFARRVLCITATSVPCERGFSKGGYIVNKRRCCLSDNNVSLLMFLSCNRQHAEQEK